MEYSEELAIQYRWNIALDKGHILNHGEIK